MIENKSLRKRQGISLKRLKAFQVTQQLTQTILKSQSKQAQNTSIKRINNLQNTLSTKRTKAFHHSRYTSNIEEISSKQNKKQLHHKTMPIKFTKLSLNNPISNKHDQNIERIVEDITPKSQGFYKFGFKSYQKPSHKRVFSDMMNMPKQEMNGLLFIGELWNHQMTQKFMKANNVNLSKRKLFQKLKDMKLQKSKKQKQRMMDSRQLISSVREFSQRSMKSIQSFQKLQSMISINSMGLDFMQEDDLRSQQQSQTTSQKLCRKQEFEQISKTFRQSLDGIRGSIDEQCKRCKDQQYWKRMKGLEKQSTQIHNIWDKYFTKLLQNQ